MGVLSNLEPKPVFEYFEKLCAVPHGSYNTKQVSDLCVGFAKALGLRWRQDGANNVVIWKDASPGAEHAKPVILQGHMDMVCAKTPDCAKDMAKEGLDLATDGEWIWAEKTSLGGDDGIAVAMILALLADDTLVHPPIEAVFTTEEEVGMDGARALDCADLKGRELLNLDSEEEGIFTVSCAGGLRADCVLPCKASPLAGERAYKLTLSGLQGGHSGTDIDKGRASANRLAARLLLGAAERFPSLRLAGLNGGQFDNVICSHAEAAAAVDPKDAAAFEGFLKDFAAALRNEYAGSGDNLALALEPADGVTEALDAASTGKALRFLAILPQGVQAMSADFPGLVQTSANVGVLRLDAEGVHAAVSIRSSVDSQKEMVLQQLLAAASLAGARVTTHGNYSGWRYAPESSLRERLLASYKALTGKEAEVVAIHAGLECGLFAEKLPGLDAVSIGPDVRDVHSVKERLSVASTARTYELVRRFLKDSVS